MRLINKKDAYPLPLAGIMMRAFTCVIGYCDALRLHTVVMMSADPSCSCTTRNVHYARTANDKWFCPGVIIDAKFYENSIFHAREG